MTIIEQAYAKINLGLNVLGKRADGYHDIRSLFQTVECADTLELTIQEEPGLVTNDPSLPTGTENLVLKAETALRRERPELPRIRFSLKKNIPTGAGLGGGSADAAAALRGLSSFHRLDLDGDTLRTYGAEIGSDVPFLISGGTAVVTGRGEVIEPVEWPFHFTYVLVYPGYSVSTAWAYKNLDPDRTPNVAFEEALSALRGGALDRNQFLAAMINDFEKPLFRAYPDLASLKKQFLGNGALASILSGSGSAMIGIFENDMAAYHCANIIQMKNPLSYRIFTVQETPAMTGF